MGQHRMRTTTLLVAAIAGLATAVRRGGTQRMPHVPRIGETALGEPGEVLWYC